MAGRMHTVVTEGEAARLPEGFHRMASDDRVLLPLTASRGAAARLRQKLPEIALAGPTRRRKAELPPLLAGPSGRAQIALPNAGRPRAAALRLRRHGPRSEEHTPEPPALMPIQ